MSSKFREDKSSYSIGRRSTTSSVQGKRGNSADRFLDELGSAASAGRRIKGSDNDTVATSDSMFARFPGLVDAHRNRTRPGSTKKRSRPHDDDGDSDGGIGVDDDASRILFGETDNSDAMDVEPDTKDERESGGSGASDEYTVSDLRHRPVPTSMDPRKRDARRDRTRKDRHKDRHDEAHLDDDEEGASYDSDNIESASALFRTVNKLGEFPHYSGKEDDLKSLRQSVLRRSREAAEEVTPEYLSRFYNVPFMKFIEEACGEDAITTESAFFRRPPLECRTYAHFRPHMNPTFVSAVSRTSYLCDLFSRRHHGNRPMTIDDMLNYFPVDHPKHERAILACAVTCGCLIRKNLIQNPTKSSITRFSLSNTMKLLVLAVKDLEYEIRYIDDNDS